MERSAMTYKSPFPIFPVPVPESPESPAGSSDDTFNDSLRSSGILREPGTAIKKPQERAHRMADTLATTVHVILNQTSPASHPIAFDYATLPRPPVLRYDVSSVGEWQSGVDVQGNLKEDWKAMYQYISALQNHIAYLKGKLE